MGSILSYIFVSSIILYWLFVTLLPSWDAKGFSARKRFNLAMLCLAFGLLIIGLFFSVYWFMSRAVSRRWGVHLRIKNRKTRLTIGILILLPMPSTFIMLALAIRALIL